MGHASTGLEVRAAETGQARIRTPAQAPERVDPIWIVNEAVRAVLAGLAVTGKPKGHDEQVFVDKLFSVRHAEGLPPGTRIVRVGPGTVVTPLAHDLLKRQGITIRLGGPGEVSSRRGEWAFAIESDGGTVEALRRGLLEDPRPWIELEPSLDIVSSWVVEGNGRGAMWITSKGALAVWLSCQLAGVRAATAAEPSEVHSAVNGLGMNLLVVEPGGKSISWMRQLAMAFRAAGAPRIPEFLAAGGRR